tara:strand:- start:199 stop:711 length:513 start_codon:yes stop_codon:yes gene_type:complete
MNNKNDDINSITLEFLLNPNYLEKIKTKSNSSDIFEEIQFYKKRIVSITKEMIKGNYENDDIKNIFFQYTNSLIYHFKNIDKKDLIQEEYNNLTLSEKKNFLNNSNYLTESDEIIKITKKDNNYNLDKFVKIKNSKNLKFEKNIIPNLKVLDLTNPDLKEKGVKKKKIDK